MSRCAALFTGPTGVLRAASLAVVACVCWSSADAAGSEAAQACVGLRDLRLSGATIVSADPVEAGAFRTAAGKPLRDQKALCRVVGIATPSADSRIGFEVWMPLSDWNGRLWGLGNFD